MKIERISENSIRCTLTSFDLSVRDLNIKELAYGTDKVRKLFTEMMTRASNEVGFEADGTPIMIEAIPLSSDSIQLVITKVDNPEELDARFSRFSPGPQTGAGKGKENDWLHKLTSELLEGAAGFLAQVQNAQENSGAGNTAGPNVPNGPASIPLAPGLAPGKAVLKKNGNGNAAGPQIPEVSCRAIGFDDLDTVFEAARAAGFYTGESILYKKPGTGRYVLLIRGTRENHDSFAKVCNILTEYGYSIHTTLGTGAYYDEHYHVITPSPAISTLSAVR